MPEVSEAPPVKMIGIKHRRKDFHRPKRAIVTLTHRANGEPKLKVTGAIDRRADEALVAKIVEYLKEGASYSNAAVRAGIHEATFYRWMAEGKTAPSGTLARSFYELVRFAEEEAIYDATKVIKAGMKSDPKWAAWFLARRRPKEWSETTKIAGDADLDPIQTETKSISKGAILHGIRAVLKKNPDLLKK